MTREHLFPTLVTAFALAMDAVAVAIAAGLARGGKATRADATYVASCFGGFQAAMPIAGAFVGELVRSLVASFASPVAGVVLAVLGANEVRNALGGDDEKSARDYFHPRVLFLLGIATSLDAFAAGISLSLLGAPLLACAAIIGAVTFALSYAGVVLASRLDRLFGSRTELLGGVALLALGTKLVFEGI